MALTAKARWIDGLEFMGESGSGHGMIMSGGMEAGGRNLGPTPMEMLLMGLGGCTGMDVVHILRKKRVEVYNVEAEVRGEMADTYPHKYTAIDIQYTITGKDLTEDAVKRAIDLSMEKYCHVKGTLEAAAKITWSYRILNR